MFEAGIQTDWFAMRISRVVHNFTSDVTPNFIFYNILKTAGERPRFISPRSSSLILQIYRLGTRTQHNITLCQHNKIPILYNGHICVRMQWINKGPVNSILDETNAHIARFTFDASPPDHVILRNRVMRFVGLETTRLAW